MGLLSRLFGRDASRDDEPASEQLASVRLQFEQLRRVMAESGVDDQDTLQSMSLSQECDEIAGATGPFGLCDTNPIPVNGVEGERVYLHRLMIQSGQPVYFHRIGSVSLRNIGCVDEYEVLAFDKSVRTRLYFCMSYPRRSRLAPNGFFLRSWRDMTDLDRAFAKLGVWGTNSFVSDFPGGVFTAVEERAAQIGAPGGVCAMSTVLAKMLINRYAKGLS